MENTQSIRRTFIFYSVMLLLAAGLAAPNSQADIVSTVDIVTEQQLSATRERVLQELDRAEVRSQLERLGVDTGQAQERVAAMTDTEVAELAENMDQLAAGSSITISLGTLLLILIIVLLVG